MEAQILHHTKIDRTQWDAFILQSPQGMVYHCYDYLLAMADDWEAIVVTSGVEWTGVMPISRAQKWGFTYAMQPIFAQYWGICFKAFEAKVSKAFEARKEVVNLVIDALPKEIRLLDYHFAPQFDYLAPFNWRGFAIRLRFTMQIDVRGSLDSIWGQFADGARRDVRKAEKAGITIAETTDFEALIALFLRSRGDQVQAVKPDHYQRLLRAYQNLAASGASIVLGAYNADQQLVGGILFFRYKTTTIYYFGGTADAYRNSGAMALIIWESIRRWHGQATVYDFDGSMIEGIERYFRSFGAVPVPYYRVRKLRFPFSMVPSLRD